MTEAFFPLVGPLVVFFVVLPLSAVLAKLVLLGVARFSGEGASLHDRQRMRYLLLVASSGVPLAWFISASVHQAESGLTATVCAVDHAGASCDEPALFAVALITLVGALLVPRLLRGYRAVRPSTSPTAERAATRLAALVQSRPSLWELRGRILSSDTLHSPIATVGIFSPAVAVRSSFASALDDDALVAALHHELEHVRARDPLRYLAISFAVAVNPLGRWILGGELSRWILARETHCDRAAVLGGASSPALAHALVTAARAPMPALLTVGLGSTGAPGIKLRVDLLMAYSDRLPRHCCGEPALRIALLLMAVAFALPHGSGTDALDMVHIASESTLALITGR